MMDDLAAEQRRSSGEPRRIVMDIEEQIKAEIEREEYTRALRELEATEMEAGRIPQGPVPPSRWWKMPAVFIGALVLGILVGLLAILAELTVTRLVP
jgi:hypothetical protein